METRHKVAMLPNCVEQGGEQGCVAAAGETIYGEQRVKLGTVDRAREGLVGFWRMYSWRFWARKPRNDLDALSGS